MPLFNADIFKALNDHWKNLYANGFAWTVNGIDGLEYKIN